MDHMEYMQKNYQPGTIIPKEFPIWPLECKTLRDEFAMAALQGLLAYPGATDIDLAESSYKYADDMLKAREKKNG